MKGQARAQCERLLSQMTWGVETPLGVKGGERMEGLGGQTPILEHGYPLSETSFESKCYVPWHSQTGTMRLIIRVQQFLANKTPKIGERRRLIG